VTFLMAKRRRSRIYCRMYFSCTVCRLGYWTIFGIWLNKTDCSVIPAVCHTSLCVDLLSAIAVSLSGLGGGRIVSTCEIVFSCMYYCYFMYMCILVVG
jgi:hypothetical protein